jgi:hypothetical protein
MGHGVNGDCPMKREYEGNTAGSVNTKKSFEEKAGDNRLIL